MNLIKIRVAVARDGHNRGKKHTSFTSCISEINNARVDNAKC